MAIEKRVTVAYQAQCDNCDAASKRCRTREEAEDWAMSEGFQWHEYYNGLTHVTRLLCWECYEGR